MGEDIEALRLNTAISAMMIYLNELAKAEPLPREAVEALVRLLHPFAPHLAEELWETLGEEGAVLRAPWPVSDPELAKENEIEVPVQVNGKLAVVVRVAVDADAKTLEAAALAEEKVQARIAGKTVAKIIVVPGKLVNLVVR